MPLFHVSDGFGEVIVFSGVVIVFLLCYFTREKGDGEK